MRYIIDTSITEYETRAPDPNDSWDIGDIEGHIDEVFVRRAADWEEGKDYYSRLGRSSYMLPEGASGTFYAVVACVGTGCTFGRQGVYAYIMAVETTRAVAEETASRMREESNGRPWHGYFEELVSLEVYPLTV